MFKKFIIFCTAVLATQLALGAVFIKFDGVDGESNVANYEAYSDVLSWSWGTVAGKRTTCVKDFQLVKEVDKSSPILLMDLVRGRSYPKVSLAVTSNYADGASDEYITLEFKNVKMTSHTTTSNADGAPIESISISFQEVTYTYFIIDQQGDFRESTSATIVSSGKC